ncbi:DctP family TRAP transporter solute-binding subunit [Brevibacillus sp. B_LB10_24]|uniref:DctP family TRAP transporter solute-binding subunit n=1 Tax=Brevibacillus sp. B_LB10_24 TaxID=3380645 RepID=UPI0038BE1669
MKKHWNALAAFVLSAALIAGCGGGKSEQASGGESSGAKDEKIKLKMSVTTSETSTWYKGAQMWADKVKEKTNGRVEIKIYANEQLSNGNQPKGIELLQNGSTDASLHSTIIYSGLDEKFSVISMPWLFTDESVADKALAGTGGEKLSELLREKGVEPLAFGENGFRQITNSKRPITSPDDMAGMKIRVPNMKMYIDLYKALGADPTSMSFSEVFTALQQGTIDGQENPMPVIMSSKLYEVQKYVSLWNYSYDPLVLGVNKKKFDSLDKETQDIMREAAVEAMEYQRKINREENAQMVKELEAKGVTVTTLTPEQVKAFQDKVAPIYDQYTDTIGKDLIDAFRGAN